jgi:type IV pilus assembly protein PilA
MKKGFTHTLNFKRKLVCGFTLLEILLVVGIIAVLAGIVILAINPTKQFSNIRNTQRKMNLAEINKALYQYYIDNSGYPSTLTTTLTEICNTGTGTTTHSVVCTGLIDLSALVPTYLVAIPADPQATSTNALYKVMKGTNNKPYVSAASAELGVTVELGTAPPAVVPCGDPTSEACWSTIASSKAWGPSGVTTGAQSNTDGSANTVILAGLAGSYPAAEYCDALSEGGYTDWYLPAKDQLFSGRVALGLSGFPSGVYYWSSTENQNYPGDGAWFLDTDYGGSMGDYYDKINQFSIRCLR